MPNKRFYEKMRGIALPTGKRIAVGLNKDNIYLEETTHNQVTSREDISDSFKRSIVQFASEEHCFEVDGMKFKATCERI